jgi:hypothetical protein
VAPVGISHQETLIREEHDGRSAARACARLVLIHALYVWMKVTQPWLE